jgi:hypothetical protein
MADRFHRERAAPRLGPADALERAGDALLATQNTDGGWGTTKRFPPTRTRPHGVALPRRLGRSGDPCRRAVWCLASHQRTENGGIATYSEPAPIRRFMSLGRWVPFGGWCSPHTEVTTAGRVLAAAALDGYADAVRVASEYVSAALKLSSILCPNQ